jgi:hypothetical protein
VSAEPSQAALDLAIARIELLEEAQQYMLQHKRDYPELRLAMTEDYWYGWQLEAFETDKPQTMVLAGNRTGKTMSAGYHTALDLTGRYPDWWKGYRFAHAPAVLVAGVSNDQLKNVVQKELFGEVIQPEDGKRKFFAGNWIHRDEIGRVLWNKQTTDLADMVEVFSKYGRSNCQLKAYTSSKTGMGTLQFSGTSKCLIWVDECPPDDLIGQLLIRLTTGNLKKGGHIRYTMTPELGATRLVSNFMDHREKSQKLIGPIAWKECKHITPEVQESILAGVPKEEHDMRARGIPFFGTGLVYNCPEDRITFEPFELHRIPYLRFLRAMDLGISHPTAIVWLAYDPEQDRIYVLRTYSKAGDAAAQHAIVANSYLPFAPLVFPPDVDVTEKGSGKTVRDYYSEAGLKNTLDFKNPDGSRFVESGIMEIDDLMKSDKFKVFSTCDDFFIEKRKYHREKGKLVKENDDVMDAMRYGAMMIKRYGIPMGGARHKPRKKKRFGWSK